MRKKLSRKAASRQYAKRAKHDKRNFKIYRGGIALV